ncbi:MAG: hypothetical protein AUJ96_10505 [Armatimonadetes bacterium CG2_30_66_41]|nr:AbrB/MazE/SpoVT family DNA-binding domain-containing protein [Armatimonadota bacterium]OIP05609.1 MAG: hypothetical protein AUJ96_10505 [Armatimonadetes bacterium CG2_30_66_41]NCO93365.1 AbrB/MazE/SpoVT family DNA-binding domain-containing protein [Armatimonadota bacterium]NCP29341.1 AbrB/MazE/SpoVT family DNA-binding domain-containing protein [Armatimonadota bacterium]NCQ31721.1 AbrB/MazE/SpoVT family DNA-binding domain-containing protein [Armatimonadota bacterium]
MATATLSARGQMTIPRVIREHLHLHPGDRLEFVIRDGQEVTIRPPSADIRELRGMLAHKVKRPVTVEEMNEAIRQRAGR